jgi:hypothetical protein
VDAGVARPLTITPIRCIRTGVSEMKKISSSACTLSIDRSLGRAPTSRPGVTRWRPKQAAREEAESPVNHSKEWLRSEEGQAAAAEPANEAVRVSHAPGIWLGSRIFVLDRPAEPLCSAPSAP